MIDNKKICLSDSTISTELIERLLETHQPIITNRFKKLQDYYNGNHSILKRAISDVEKPNNKAVANFCQYTTDILTGFFMGKPVTYTSQNNKLLNDIKNIMKANDEASENHTLAHKSSVKGQSFELIYKNENSNTCFDNLDTDSVICVYDNTIKKEIALALRYYIDKDILTNKEKTIIEVYTKNKIMKYEKVENEISFISEEDHYFKEVPIIEFPNNRYRKSDFEGIMTLNDMYNLNTSDVANDIAYFSNCYLVLENMLDTKKEDIVKLKEDRVLLTSENGKAYYLTKQLNDKAVQNHRENLKEDIHKFSYVPDLNDIGNVSNLSGNAIKQKFFATEQVICNKEREFKKALQKRLRLIINDLNLQGNNYDVNEIEIIFNRNIPNNIVELSDAVSKFAGFLPFESTLEELNKAGATIDIKKAIDLKEKEKQESLDTFDPPKNQTINNERVIENE
ncbi:hypothetical protein N493_07375 [Clostridium botulinum B2 433]|uniref:phage portal protein n=1 Tax=Clostridium botulinum TaxID=1491 RepID=UPI0007E1C7B6|nr:phage portal protein [Clostridium botulinum]KEI89322.1 hypothetical protein N493_07375 [Clostridium botulinum B2 433]